MKTLTKKQGLDIGVFIAFASLCEYNELWTCTHPNNKGEKCVEICKYYNNPEENGFQRNT